MNMVMRSDLKPKDQLIRVKSIVTIKAYCPWWRSPLHGTREPNDDYLQVCWLVSSTAKSHVWMVQRMVRLAHGQWGKRVQGDPAFPRWTCDHGWPKEFRNQWKPKCIWICGGNQQKQLSGARFVGALVLDWKGGRYDLERMGYITIRSYTRGF